MKTNQSQETQARRRGRPYRVRFATDGQRKVAQALMQSPEKWATIEYLVEVTGQPRLTVMSQLTAMRNRNLVVRRKHSPVYHLSFVGEYAVSKEL